MMDNISFYILVLVILNTICIVLGNYQNIIRLITAKEMLRKNRQLVTDEPVEV